MKSSYSLFLILLILLVATVTPMPVNAQVDFPRLSSVTPTTASVGDELVAEGENLDRKNVKEIYLTTGQIDYKAVIVEQTATSIKFRIAKGTKPGRFNLMLLTGGKEPRLIEEPVKVTVE